MTSSTYPLEKLHTIKNSRSIPSEDVRDDPVRDV